LLEAQPSSFDAPDPLESPLAGLRSTVVGVTEAERTLDQLARHLAGRGCDPSHL
jgi:hypothetical protein